MLRSDTGGTLTWKQSSRPCQLSELQRLGAGFHEFNPVRVNENYGDPQGILTEETAAEQGSEDEHGVAIR
jgi:hypothetical protein